ncbi:MAG: hypothetical protein RL235_767 [Chlamydiota bacterium]|jgi:hypothetical protein
MNCACVKFNAMIDRAAQRGALFTWNGKMKISPNDKKITQIAKLIFGSLSLLFTLPFRLFCSLTKKKRTVAPRSSAPPQSTLQTRLTDNQLLILEAHRPNIYQFFSSHERQWSQYTPLSLPPINAPTEALSRFLCSISALCFSETLSAELPTWIQLLVNLETLFLDGTAITTLPPEIGNLKRLHVLRLQKSPLATLPPEIGNLTELRQLVVLHGNLTTLPSELRRLTNLELLRIENCQLTRLPPELQSLHKLEVLSLRSNPLQLEPGLLTQLPALRSRHF